MDYGTFVLSVPLLHLTHGLWFIQTIATSQLPYIHHYRISLENKNHLATTLSSHLLIVYDSYNRDVTAVFIHPSLPYFTWEPPSHYIVKPPTYRLDPYNRDVTAVFIHPSLPYFTWEPSSHYIVRPPTYRLDPYNRDVTSIITVHPSLPYFTWEPSSHYIVQPRQKYGWAWWYRHNKTRSFVLTWVYIM